MVIDIIRCIEFKNKTTFMMFTKVFSNLLKSFGYCKYLISNVISVFNQDKTHGFYYSAYIVILRFIDSSSF